MTHNRYSNTIRVGALAAALAMCYGANAVYAADTGQPTGTTPRAENGKPTSATQEMRLSRLIDMDVENADGRNIGEIRDIIVDANNGRVQYAVLEYGGYLGMGEKLFPFPLSVFRTNADGDELVLGVPDDRLRKAPGFPRDKWPDWNTPDYRGTIDRYYDSRPVQNARFVRGSKLLDADLRAPGGERIGEVEDVVANILSGQISYVVVEFDRGWFTADKLVALPLRALNPVRQYGLVDSDLVLNVDKGRLQSAPAFKRDQWPDASTFRRDVDQYWGLTYGPPPSAAGDPATLPREQQSRK